MNHSLTSAWPPHPLTSDQTTPAQVAAAVMAVLRDMAPTTKSVSAPAKSALIKTPDETASNSSTEAFSGSLLLERHALDLGGQVRELVVSPKTVVTPLARELLKKRKISLRLATAANWPGQFGQKSGEWAVLRIAANAQALAVESTLAGRSGEGWELAGPTLTDAATWLSARPYSHVAVLAEVACLSLWRLHQAGLRAAEVRTALEVERVAQQFAPQCIVVEPARLPIHETRQIFHTWRRLGVVAVPAGLSETLSGQGAGS